jgi:calcineurin-like phosphoesterase family protein
MNDIWFTSDTHFYHKNILKFCPNTRTGSDYLEMTEDLIHNWNRDVRKGDRVYLLGDVCFSNAVDTRNVLRRLNGQIHLVYGNHDRVIQSNRDIQQMFTSIDNYKEIKIGQQKVVLFHFPMLEWNSMHHGAYALFGHVHGSMDNHPEVVNWRTMDVGIDSRPGGIEPAGGKMSLWNWEQVQSILSKREIKSHHGKKGEK